MKKKGEGVVTGLIWFGVLAIASGTIAAAIWGGSGISGAAGISQDIVGPTAGSAISDARTAADAIAVP